jgi:hypothetical protein
MSSSYIRHIFDIEDGKVSFDKLGQKKRGRKPGYSHSFETKKKIADRMKNRTKSPEVREKISKSLRGRTKPDEVREKISKSKSEHHPGKDLRACYGLKVSNPKPPPDKLSPTLSTVEWMSKCGLDIKEAQEWIEEHWKEFDEIATDVTYESRLRAMAKREDGNLEMEFKE